ncbi:hypothetical protein MNBD_GAMMA22-1433 [hydrothermal vent metagenome]|uniref:O-antigen ligase-related domain-containing protein n=1 Tax=hydrothermal vent metagenome TaxID=652676 RepID=A0A3B1AC31_9ZZZZ
MNAILKKENFNWITILLVVLVFVNPLLYWGELRDAASLPRHILLALFSSVGFCIWVITSYKNKKPIVIHIVFIPILIFLVWSALSLTWTVDIKNGVIELIQLVSLMVIAFITSQLISKERLIIIAAASVISAAIVSFIGIQQYFNFNPFNYIQLSEPASTFTVTNLVSIYLDLIVPVAFMFFLSADKRHFRWIFALCFSLSLSFLLLSRTRGSWIGLFIAIIVLVFILYKNLDLRREIYAKIKNRKYLLIFSLAIPIIILNIPGNTYKGGYSKLSYDESAGIRLTAYVNSMSMIKDKPILGTGIGGFRIGFRPYMFDTLPLKQADEDINLLRLHSDPLQYIVELGAPIGLLVIFTYLFIMILIWQLINKEDNNRIKLIYIGIFLSLLASGAHSWVDFPLRKPSSAIQVSIWVGALIGLHMVFLKSKKIVASKFIFVSLFLVSVALILINIVFYNNYAESNVYLNKAQKSMLASDCNSAKNFIKVSYEKFGFDFLANSNLVQIFSFCGAELPEKLYVMNLVLNFNPTNTRALITRGNLYLSSGNLNMAKQDFEKLIKILPNRAGGYFGLGNIALVMKQYKVAKKYYRIAIKKNTIAQNYFLSGPVKNHKANILNVRQLKNININLKNVEQYLLQKNY